MRLLSRAAKNLSGLLPCVLTFAAVLGHRCGQFLPRHVPLRRLRTRIRSASSAHTSIDPNHLARHVGRGVAT
jgi:hypothetical protein